MTPFRGWAAHSSGAALERLDFDPGALDAEDVEIAVEYCGVCHSDLAMVDSEWFPTSYPVVPGHEVVGTIVAVGPNAKGRSVGQRVGLGCTARAVCTAIFVWAVSKTCVASASPPSSAAMVALPTRCVRIGVGPCPSPRGWTLRWPARSCVAAALPFCPL